MRRLYTWVLVIALLGATFVVIPQSTQASPLFVRDFRRSDVTFNGIVYAMAQSGKTLYVGGNFTYIGVNTGSLINVDQVTAAYSPTYPKVEGGAVRVILPDGSGGYFIGGDFTSVNGQPRGRVARILSNGNLDFNFSPSMNGTVRAMVLDGTTLYLGGDFTQVADISRPYIAAFDITNGVPTGFVAGFDIDINYRVNALAFGGGRLYAGGFFEFFDEGLFADISNIAAFNPTTGATINWRPGADEQVHALALNADATTLYAGGDFTFIGNRSRLYIAALSTSSNTAASWNPGANNSVYSLYLAGTRLIAGGAFTGFGGAVRNYLASIDVSQVTVDGWNPGADQPVRGIFLTGNTVYVGGDFGIVGGQVRDGIAAINATTGSVDTWTATAAGSVLAISGGSGSILYGGDFSLGAGVRRKGLAAIDLRTGYPTSFRADVTIPAITATVRALALSGNTLYVGGLFDTIGGQARNNLAAVDISTSTVTAFNPNVIDTVQTISVEGGIIYFGGVFNIVQSQNRSRLAAVDTSGNLTAWNPNANGTVNVVVATASQVYVGGTFDLIGGEIRSRAAAVNKTTGAALAWDPNLDNSVTAIALAGSTVYIGGLFTTVNELSRPYLAAVDATTGVLNQTWNANVSGGIVYTIALAGNTMYVGGEFTSIGGQARQGAAALNVSNASVQSWAPALNNTVQVITWGHPFISVGGAFTTAESVPQVGFALYGGYPPHTIGVFRPSLATFLLRLSNTEGVADIFVPFGLGTDYPISGDWNGDGVETTGIYRNGTFYLSNTNSTTPPVDYIINFGVAGDVPFVGDFDGNGTDDIGVFRLVTPIPNTSDKYGEIYLRFQLTSGLPDRYILLGQTGDFPVAGDWDGDGVDGIGVHRRSNSFFFLTNQINTFTPSIEYIAWVGVPDDVGFAGDWDGNGIDGVGVFRPTNGVTYLKNVPSTGIADIFFIYGLAGDFPVAGVWQAPVIADQPLGAGESAPIFVPRK